MELDDYTYDMRGFDNHVHMNILFSLI